jgi:H+/Cl- antiporter ClcA
VWSSLGLIALCGVFVVALVLCVRAFIRWQLRGWLYLLVVLGALGGMVGFGYYWAIVEGHLTG